MTSSRREFVERLAFSATGAAMLGAVPSALSASPIAEASGSAAGAWDLSWTERLKGEYKVVVDSPEVEEGGGVMRASVWSKGYADAMGTKPSQCSTVLVLRHNAIVLAMSSEYWAEYKLGEKEKVNDPVTNKPAVRNPVLLNSREHGTPARYDDMALDKFIGRGNVVRGCGQGERCRGQGEGDADAGARCDPAAVGSVRGGAGAAGGVLVHEGELSHDPVEGRARSCPLAFGAITHEQSRSP
jgi:hypothetical protein